MPDAEGKRSTQKERGARQTHKRLLYCVNVTSTSLDHLLLGMAADGDQMSHAPSIPRFAKIFQNQIALSFRSPEHLVIIFSEQKAYLLPAIA